MNQNYDEILKAALALSPEDRLRLIDELSEPDGEEGTLPFDPAWLDEIQRRSAEFDTGGVTPIPWEKVKQRARQEESPGG